MSAHYHDDAQCLRALHYYLGPVKTPIRPMHPRASYLCIKREEQILKLRFVENLHIA